MASHHLLSKIQSTLQCLQRKHSRIWPWILHGFASCSFPLSSLVISQNKPVLSKSFALETTVFSTVAFLLAKALHFHWTKPYPYYSTFKSPFKHCLVYKTFLDPQTNVKAFFSPGTPLHLILTSSIIISVCNRLHVFFLPKLNSLRKGLCCHFDSPKCGTVLSLY